MRILVLYEELAWYFLNCLNSLCTEQPCEILLFRKKINAVAPFQFSSIHKSITIKDREDFSEENLLKSCKQFAPDYIFLGGWSQKKYIQVVKKLKVKKTIIGFDNQWEGNARQVAGALYFRLFLKKYIHKAFVPGKKQKKFAAMLGFKEKEIIPDAYCCDFDFFNSVYLEYKEKKQREFPRRFLYVGRYAEEKAVQDLWQAFIELKNESKNDWQLWCLGKGEISPAEHPDIKHLGFKQPSEMKQFLGDTSVFVLPSLFEPWGVVVHEHAAAGFPLICSDKVCSAERFLSEGENGYIFEAGNVKQLKEKLRLFMNMSNEKFNLMSEKSVSLAAEVVPAKWARNLMNGFLS